MKKNLSNLLAVSLVAAMAFTFTGCGAKKEAPAETAAVSTEAATEEAVTEEAATEEAATEEVVTEEATTEESSGADTLKAFVETPEIQEAMASVSESQDDMSIELKVEGDDTVVMSLSYKEQLDLSDESSKEIMLSVFESQMAAQESMFTEMRDQIVEETGMDDVIVRIEYLNADGSEIYSQEYTK